MANDAYQIDVGSDPLIAVGEELVRFVQRVARGRRIHVSTAYRWALRGVRGRRLPTARIGGRLYTSKGAFSWWASALSGDLIGDVPVREPLLEQSADEVASILRKAGIKP